MMWIFLHQAAGISACNRTAWCFCRFIKKAGMKVPKGTSIPAFQSVFAPCARCKNENQASFWKVAASKEPIAWHTLHTSGRFS